MKKERILVLCTQNSARSQMAEGLFRHMAGERFEVESAGSKPSLVNPYAIKVLAEIGIDISEQYSKNLAKFINEKFDYVITVCDNAAKDCPVFPGTYKKIHWSLPDPGVNQSQEEEIIKAFRQTRDKLKGLIFNFVKN